MARLFAICVGVATLGYPFALYLARGHAEPGWLAIVPAGLALARAVATRHAFWLAVAGGAAVLGAASLVGDDLLPLKLYPVLVNLVLLAVFGLSLGHPPTVIERIARLTEPDLPPAGVAYTRRVTQVWCVFFVVNGALALWTAVRGSMAAWTLYNGLAAYLLMGALFAGEWLVRRRVLSRAGAARG